ncbi:MAG: XRE family transcriptional regulator [Prevotellaceae bacterium]|jgi:hypothetical protein|nr:XRE family transcriptional regulator [Prevotellaceae bacterium]
MNTFHIGNLIKQKVDEKQLSVTQFAKMIHCERTNVYHIFANDTIDLKRLKIIQNALDYNFLIDIFPEFFPKINFPSEISVNLKISDIPNLEQYNKIFTKLQEILL